MSKQKRQQVVLALLVAMIGVAGVWVFFVSRQVSAVQKSRARIADLERQLTEATKTAEQAAKNLPLKEKLRNFVEAQETAMVTGDSFAWVVREITLLAEQHPVREVSLRSGNRVPHTRKSRHECYVTKLEFSGGYDQIGAFICDLENKFPTAEVRSLELTGGEAGGGRLRAIVELALLIRPQTETKTTGGKQQT
jgi:Tfp pilus assembly protein PilO